MVGKRNALTQSDKGKLILVVNHQNCQVQAVEYPTFIVKKSLLGGTLLSWHKIGRILNLLLRNTRYHKNAEKDALAAMAYHRRCVCLFCMSRASFLQSGFFFIRSHPLYSLVVLHRFACFPRLSRAACLT